MKTTLLHCVKSMMMIVLLSISGLAFADSDYYDESVPPQPKAFYDINLTSPESMVDFLWVVGTDPENLFDDILVIDNAFASSIWYQTRGYALISISQLP